MTLRQKRGTNRTSSLGFSKPVHSRNLAKSKNTPPVVKHPRGHSTYHSTDHAIYPGSFDPITNGHVDIVHRALTVFDRITIVIASSSRKHALLSVDERLKLTKEIFKSEKKVSVLKWDGLIMDYAHKVKANVVIRGLRAASDFEYEFMMAAMNKDLNPNVETLFMMTGQNLFFISSSMVKELFSYGGDISSYVPKKVNQYLMSKRKAGLLK